MEYQEFLTTKALVVKPVGFEISSEIINPLLFPHQRDIAKWALRKGKAAIFLAGGLGKAPITLEWAHHVARHTGGSILILAPLAVSHQLVREAEKFGRNAKLVRTQADVDGSAPIYVTNYQRLHLFDAKGFAGVACDESSIIKHHNAKTFTQLCEAFSDTPYKLCATATPSPNDHTELGTHSEFLGIMRRQEMLAEFFCHDGGNTSEWRLKGHAQDAFWKWLAGWSVAMRLPSDLGYPDDGYILPAKHRHQIITSVSEPTQGYMFAVEARSMSERRTSRRDSLADRVAACAEIVNKLPADESVLIWCNLNAESKALLAAINGAVEVAGEHSDEYKEQALFDFAEGRIKRLVSKPTIAGSGMNFQIARYQFFVGLSDSFEQLIQAEWRSHRFGQDREVYSYIITSELEGAVVRNIERKEKEYESLMDNLIEHMSVHTDLNATSRMTNEYRAATPMRLPEWIGA